MTALEFQGSLDANGVLQVPPAVAAQLANAASFRVLVLVPDDEGDDAWRHAGLERFFKDDSPGDSVYDNL